MLPLFVSNFSPQICQFGEVKSTFRVTKPLRGRAVLFNRSWSCFHTQVCPSLVETLPLLNRAAQILPLHSNLPCCLLLQVTFSCFDISQNFDFLRFCHITQSSFRLILQVSIRIETIFFSLHKLLHLA